MAAGRPDPPAPGAASTIDSEAIEFERAFRADHPGLWTATLIGPPLLTMALLGLAYAALGAEFARRLVVTAAAGVFFFGRFLILAGGDATLAEEGGGGFSAEELLGLVLYLDLMVATVVVFHAGVLFRTPWIGRRLAAAVADGRRLLRSRGRLRHATFAVIVAFVAFPLASTGSVGGALFGRLLGLGRARTMVAIVLGSVLGAGAMYVGAEAVSRVVDRNDASLRIAGVLVVVALILVLNWRYRRFVAGSLSDRRDDPGRA